MRTFLRGKITLLFMTLGLLLAVPAVALAADLATDADLGSTAAAPTEVYPNDTKDFKIKVWAEGNYQSGSANGDVDVVNSYTMSQAADGTTSITPFGLSTIPAGASATHLEFAQNFQYGSGTNAACPSSVPTQVSGVTGKGCAADPFIVPASLVVGNVDVGKTGQFKVTMAGSPGLAIKNTNPVGLDTGNVKVVSPPVTNTAPDVSVTGVENAATYEINDVPTAGCSVDDAEDTNESATPVFDNSGLNSYGLGTVKVTCSYTDGGGLTETASATYTIQDTGAPVISDLGPIAGTAGLNGWYTSPVKNRFQAQDFNGTTPTPDNGAGFATTGTPPLLSYNIDVTSGATQEGTAANPVVLSSGPVSDVANNTAASVSSRNYKIDLTDPQLNISGAASGTAFTACGAALTWPTFAPSDAISGLDGSQADSWTTPANGVGTYTYKADAKDLAGRTASETRTYTRTYGSAYTGLQQPINAGSTPRSVFKLGSTVPLKFFLSCTSGPITDANATFSITKIDSQPDGAINETPVDLPASLGNTFRLADATSGQYIFNLSTKSLTAGTYSLKVDLNDGSATRDTTVTFDVRK